MAHNTGTRQAQKSQTRQALLETALRLMEHQSLSSLSLREITREVGIVPTGFYRHFPDVESLGVALVEQCLGSLRTAIRAVRADITSSDELIRRSVDVLAREVHAHRERFRFIARERYGGVSRVRAAIREQLDLSGEELASDLLAGDLAAASALDQWAPDDLQMLTQLIVNHMVLTAAAILDVPLDQPDAERHIIDTAGKQLQLIVLGSRQWLNRAKARQGAEPDAPPRTALPRENSGSRLDAGCRSWSRPFD
jgi:AcrR family transcriptional regulator